MIGYSEMNLSVVGICRCEGHRVHGFELETHSFPDGTTENLPAMCPDNDLMRRELYKEFRPVLETLEANENWTVSTCYSGMIAEIKPGLFLYSFGDLDEIGEENFYVKTDLAVLLDSLINEWGTEAPRWREFLKRTGSNGLPSGYEPASMVDHKIFFPQFEGEGLIVGVY